MDIPPVADGSGVTNHRADASCIRIVDSYMRVCRTADRLLAELDRTSSTGSGVIRLPLDDSDTPTR
jgi:hypothetical protein